MLNYTKCIIQCTFCKKNRQGVTNMKMNKLAVILLLIPTYSNAAPIDPGTISEASGCNFFSTTDCTVNWESQLYIPDMDVAAVHISRSSGTSWLIRYNLYGSNSGNIWLEAPDTLSPTNNFNIFADQVDRSFYNPSYYFGMTDTDVLNGSASYHISGEPDYIESGNLIFSNSYMHICIECSADVTLNLNGLDYSRGTLNILTAFLEPRNNPLLSMNQYNPYGGDDYTGSYSSYEFNTSPVPVPAAFWLFSTGLLALVGFRKKKIKI